MTFASLAQSHLSSCPQPHFRSPQSRPHPATPSPDKSQLSGRASAGQVAGWVPFAEVDLYPPINIRLTARMQHFIEEDSNHNLLSPTLFISGLDCAPSQEEAEYPDQSELGERQAGKASLDGTRDCEKEEKKRQAGLKSREKKKKYLERLEESVKQLSSEIESTESQIWKCKNQLVESIRATASQHGSTFMELERSAAEEYPDIDRINLLLDLIQNRIGANAKERQANLDYNFKQIINSLFPAMHRYFMHTARHAHDLFHPATMDYPAQTHPYPHPLHLTLTHLQTHTYPHISQPWTKEFFSFLKLSQSQVERIALKQEEFLTKRRDAILHIGRLKRVKQELLNQQEMFERALSDIREDMTPVQSALIIVFGEKNKLRRQFSVLADQFEGYHPSKKAKLQPIPHT